MTGITLSINNSSLYPHATSRKEVLVPGHRHRTHGKPRPFFLLRAFLHACMFPPDLAFALRRLAALYHVSPRSL